LEKLQTVSWLSSGFCDKVLRAAGLFFLQGEGQLRKSGVVRGRPRALPGEGSVWGTGRRGYYTFVFGKLRRLNKVYHSPTNNVEGAHSREIPVRRDP